MNFVSSVTAWLQASYHGVPIVGMAMIGEQPDNLARAMDRGYGLTVSVKRLGTLAQDLEQALKRLLGEASFRTNAERISHIMRAHRLTPVEKAAGKLKLPTSRPACSATCPPPPASLPPLNSKARICCMLHVRSCLQMVLPEVTIILADASSW